MKKKLLIFFLCNFIFIGYSFAHGDLDERILKVTKEIKVAPDSAYLYLKRGKLYFQHEAFNNSIADLNTSKTLGYRTTEQTLLFAKSYFGLKTYEKAMTYCNEILSDDPKNVRAIKLIAQTHFEQGNFTRSAYTFEDLINYTNQSFPKNYVDASQAWESLNTKEGFKRATAIINNGIDKLGPLISLYSRLKDLAVKQKHYDSAIETQHQIIKLSPRKETAYYNLSELFLLNNSKEEALESLNLAKTHFNNLPTRLQNTSFMKELIENIKSKESQLKLN
jgi:tetratricopeptide (TPR) repeat protein